ncbi:MAG: hypothetical protein ABGW99_03265 [Zunongwangia sp.]|uniref:hypothetical protein n=1 Tax=Zunongwangia sp. TaxID=1965325 RepID=UPI003242BB27|tara:strand:+ start:12969 stop:13157 length:189 start_codon:yes stop_codon:yes gene_type:complete
MAKKSRCFFTAALLQIIFLILSNSAHCGNFPHHHKAHHIDKIHFSLFDATKINAKIFHNQNF